MKLVSFFLKKYNLSIIALFESHLFKNNRHNYKQSNIMNIKKWIQINDKYSANRYVTFLGKF
jgi:hypothetical protein